MRALQYIKTTLKGMISNGVVTILNFILLPIIIACFMAFIQNTAEDNPLKLKILNVKVIDNDNSQMSDKLVEFLNSDDIKELINIVDNDPEVELVINEGYGDNLLSLNKGTIEINRMVEGREFTANTFKTILDKYHQSLYVSLSGGSLDRLNEIDSSIIVENEFVDVIKTATHYEKIASSMIGFVVTMLIFSTIQSGYMELSVNLDKRINAAPISRLQYLFYDSAALFVYVFIIISAYVLFFRIAGLSFTGSVIGLITLVFTTTALVVSLAKTISTVFGAKYGKMIGTVLFVLPLISMEMFMGEGNGVAVLTPTHYLNNAFSIYNLNGNLLGAERWIILILAGSIVIYAIAVIKEIIKGRVKLWA